MCNAAETDESIRKILEELEAMGAVYLPLQPAESSSSPPLLPETVPEPSKPKRIRSRKPLAAVASTSAKASAPASGKWTVKPSTESPTISWTDKECLYAVQNPDNRGDTLLKLQVYNHGSMVHNSGVYLHNDSDDNEIYISIIDLVERLENLWVDRNTGVPKIDGLVQTITPLPAWRLTAVNSGDCTTSKIGGNQERSPTAVSTPTNKRRRHFQTHPSHGSSIGDLSPIQ